MRERIKELDFIRAVCTLGIVAYHFAVQSVDVSTLGGAFCFLNGVGKSASWGAVFVSVFFVLSGFALEYNNRSTGRLYFWKRFKGIYPLFYVAFLIYYIRDVLSNGSVFYLGSSWKILLSIIGLDGFFSYKFQTYYQVGEWFLGAIIILYILYPLLKKAAANRSGQIGMSVFLLLLFAGMIWSYHATDFWDISPGFNLISDVVPFWAGILLCKYREAVFQRKRWYALAGAALFAVGYLLPDYAAASRTMSLGLFLLLYFIGHYAMRIRPVGYAASRTAALSYAIYLMHHKFIYDATAWIVRIHDRATYFLVLGALIVLIYMAAWVIRQAGDAICKSMPMRRGEEWITSRENGAQE